jgi:hypothetical protein
MVPQHSFAPGAAAFLSEAICAPFEWRQSPQ